MTKCSCSVGEKQNTHEEGSIGQNHCMQGLTRRGRMSFAARRGCRVGYFHFRRSRATIDVVFSGFACQLWQDGSDTACQQDVKSSPLLISGTLHRRGDATLGLRGGCSVRAWPARWRWAAACAVSPMRRSCHRSPGPALDRDCLGCPPGRQRFDAFGECCAVQVVLI